ncbi:von Willebrand factor C domain-containing protein 2-like [Mactra antiquata]
MTTLSLLSKGCLHEGQVYSSGEKFQTSPCVHCVCDPSGQVLCLAGACVMPPCVDAVNDPDQCCPVCPNGENCRHSDGTIIRKGEVYNPDTKTTCMCPNNDFLFSTHSAICLVEPITEKPVFTVDPVRN